MELVVLGRVSYSNKNDTKWVDSAKRTLVLDSAERMRVGAGGERTTDYLTEQGCECRIHHAKDKWRRVAFAFAIQDCG